MDDRANAIAALEKAGFIPNVDQDGKVYFRDDGQCHESVSFGRDRARVNLNVAIAELLSLLSPEQKKEA